MWTGPGLIRHRVARLSSGYIQQSHFERIHLGSFEVSDKSAGPTKPQSLCYQISSLFMIHVLCQIDSPEWKDLYIYFEPRLHAPAGDP